MKKVLNQLIAYALWIVDLLLAFWLAFLSRSDILAIFGLFYKKGNYYYRQWVGVIDRIFILVVGLGWLIFMIIIEEYYRRGIPKGDLLKRGARITGQLLISIFVVDLVLFWLQGIGIGSINWLRWLILAVEMGIGIALLVLAKTWSIS
jgi:hypothetical protein